MLGLPSAWVLGLAALGSLAVPLRNRPHEISLALVGERPTLNITYRLQPDEREALVSAFDTDHDHQLNLDERAKLSLYLASIAAGSFRMLADGKPVTLTPLTPIECMEGCATGMDQSDPITVCFRPQIILGRELTLSFEDDHPHGRVPLVMLTDATVVRSSQRPSTLSPPWKSYQELFDLFRGKASVMAFQLPARRPVTVSLRRSKTRQ